MSMWSELNDIQLTNQKIGMDMAKKHDPLTWVQLEAAVREAYAERARRLDRNLEINEAIAEMFLEEEIYLVWPIIRRFCQQR